MSLYHCLTVSLSHYANPEHSTALVASIPFHPLPLGGLPIPDEAWPGWFSASPASAPQDTQDTQDAQGAQDTRDTRDRLDPLEVPLEVPLELKRVKRVLWCSSGIPLEHVCVDARPA
jgi:hypothetical protein